MARRSQRAITHLSILIAAFAAVFFFASVSSGHPQTNANVAIEPQSPTRQSLSAQPPSAPTGANRCVTCHPSAVEGYARSAMSRSLRRAGQEPQGIVNAGNTKITMHSSAEGYWQRWENAGDISEYRIDYVVGSGNHASGYLFTIGDHLFQSPVAYYKSRQAYGLAPGYENLADPDFTRPVSEECVLCHSGTALHVPGTLNQYRAPVFSAEGITCERCHGPTEKHLADPRAGTIISPSKLERAERDSVCEQCHLFGISRVPNPGKNLSDFIPGQRTEATYTTYRIAVPEGSPADDFKVISHVEQLALSACARHSEGRLWCGTCHDPHDKPLAPDSVRYYRQRCLSCHTAEFAPAHPSKETNCLKCHMPRRNAKDGGHTAFTDHRIQRRPEPQRDWPATDGIAAWREPSSDVQKRNLGIAYIDVGMQRHSSAFVIQGYRTLTEVQKEFRGDADFFKWIGEALLLGRQTGDAKIAFERALQLEPNSALAEAGAASPYIQEGDAAGAIPHLERVVALDPLNLPVASTLIGLYQKEGKTSEADALSSRIKTATSENSGPEGKGADAANSRPEKSAEVFKNIQVLKNVPAKQLISAMQFVSSSLGVECSFCHVEGHFEKDDKKTKRSARGMMGMVLQLNGNNFAGQRQITCYTCHRGSRIPEGTPVAIPESSQSAPVEAPRLSSKLPTVSELLNSYIRALGGAAAIAKNTSRVETGVAIVQGHAENIEILTRAPGQRVVVRHAPDGQTVTGFDGNSGWISMPGSPTHDLHGADLEEARMDADLLFPLHIQQMFPVLRVEYPEKINDRQVNVLYGKSERQSAKLYFDQQSGMLVRVARYVDSPLGVNTTQSDFGDYREVDRLQLPFRVTLSQPGNIWRIQMQQILQNVDIEDSRFIRPPGGTATPALPD